MRVHREGNKETQETVGATVGKPARKLRHIERPLRAMLGEPLRKTRESSWL